MQRHRLLWLVCLALFCLPLSLSAQTTTGTVRGYVKDQNGTAVADAAVEARDTSTGTARTATSRADGSYVLPGLTPGTYELSVRHIGFGPQRRAVVVQIGATSSVDFTLQAGAVELQAVSIEAAPQAEVRTSEVATNVTSKQIQQLPTPSRNFLDLAALAPGVTVTEDRTDGTSRNFSAGAQGANDVNVFVDGASLKNDLTAGGVAGQDASRGNPFPRSAIQEYRVVTQNFKAEYQRSSSAIITATTRSGGNEWHGNALFAFQDKNLVALDTFQNANPSFSKPDYKRYLASFSLGGPIIRDKAQVFFSYEGNYQDRSNLVNMTPPPAGSFPALDTVNLARYNGNFGSPFRETLLFAKLNYTVSRTSTAELSFNNRHETDVRDFGGNTAFQTAVNYRNNVGMGLLKFNTFKGPWLNEAQLTYQRFQRNPSPDDPGLPNRVYERAASGAQIGSNLTIQDFTQRRIGVRDDITNTGWKAGGDHVLKAGVNLDFLNYDVDKRNRDTPQFFYTDTLNRNGRVLAYDYRNPYQMIVQSGAPGLTTDNNQIGVYVQDDWSPSQRLTVNLGIRWDYESHMLNYDYVTPQDVRDTIHAYYASLIVPIDTNEYYTNGSQRERFYGAFQPRLGFSYGLDAENRTVLFGGFGIFYDRSIFDISVDERLKLQRPEYTVQFADPDSTPRAGEIAWNDAYLTTDRSVIDPLLTNGQSASKEVWLIGNHTKAPRSNQWNLGVRHLFGMVLVSAAYVGVRGYDQLVFNWANLTVNANGGCCLGGNFGHGFSNILYTTETGRTWYDALQVQVNRPYVQRPGKIGWGAGLTYTYGSRQLEGVDNTDDQFAFPQATIIKKHPANDEKSRVVANWITDLPFLAGIQFSGLITLGSGQVYDIGGRFDLSTFEPGGFSPPKSPFLIGDFWRYRRVDVKFRKDFPSLSSTTIGVTLDVFNVFNYNNYGSYNLPTNTSDPNFGKPTGVISDPRRLQLGAEVNF